MSVYFVSILVAENEILKSSISIVMLKKGIRDSSIIIAKNKYVGNQINC